MMRRPSLISAAKGGVTLWSSGTYKYDGSGNVVKTGNGYFLYDRVSRLLEGRIQDGPTGGGTQKWQSYAYDPFGNIQSIGGTSGRSTPTSSSTNRLTGAGTVYDSAGNLTNWNANVYEYDRFNQMTRMLSGAEDWRYIYTAGDERFWSYRVGGGGSLWSLRDLDGRLLREYEAHTSWSTFKDYVYRGTQLLGSDHPAEGARHFHLDHLGTPRLVTAAGTGGDFFTLTPCRVYDSRLQSGPLAAGETRTVSVAGTCGIPANAAAVAVNLSVVNATTLGEMTAYPANESRPVASAISYRVGSALSNNGILKLGNGALAFYNNQPFGSTHLVIDVTGYFTEGGGSVVAYHAYYPFGEEATAFNQDSEQMKFTGHERDLGSLVGAGDDLDYMHARHCSPLTGRFLSIDPHLDLSEAMVNPQMWNRFAYVRSNPLSKNDPSGKFENRIYDDFYRPSTQAQLAREKRRAKALKAIKDLQGTSSWQNANGNQRFEMLIQVAAKNTASNQEAIAIAFQAVDRNGIFRTSIRKDLAGLTIPAGSGHGSIQGDDKAEHILRTAELVMSLQGSPAAGNLLIAVGDIVEYMQPRLPSGGRFDKGDMNANRAGVALGLAIDRGKVDLTKFALSDIP